MAITILRGCLRDFKQYLLDGFSNRWPKWWPFLTKKRLRTAIVHYLTPLEDLEKELPE